MSTAAGTSLRNRVMAGRSGNTARSVAALQADLVLELARDGLVGERRGQRVAVPRERQRLPRVARSDTGATRPGRRRPRRAP